MTIAGIQTVHDPGHGSKSIFTCPTLGIEVQRVGHALLQYVFRNQARLSHGTRCPLHFACPPSRQHTPIVAVVCTCTTQPANDHAWGTRLKTGKELQGSLGFMSQSTSSQGLNRLAFNRQIQPPAIVTKPLGHRQTGRIHYHQACRPLDFLPRCRNTGMTAEWVLTNTKSVV